MSNFSPTVLLQKLDAALEQDNVVNKYLDKIEKKTNIKKRYIAIGKVSLSYIKFLVAIRKLVACWPMLRPWTNHNTMVLICSYWHIIDA